MHTRPTPISAPGYTKQRGANSEPNDMLVEAQAQTRFGKHNQNAASIFIRVSVAAKPGDRPLEDLAENSAELTLDQARAFAEWIVAEVDKAQGDLKQFEAK